MKPRLPRRGFAYVRNRLYHSKKFNDITPEQRELYMHDDIHPTKAGYREWWCPEMEK